jgi:regulator of sirC expression with transglutaminase-like and TPR domain
VNGVRLTVLLFFASLGCSGITYAQLDKGPMRNAMRITVYVRGANNSAVGPGVNVRLDASPGGFIDEQRTDSSGKVTFIPKALTTYVVIIHEQGFKEVVRSVDLSLTPTAAVSVQLVPLPGQPTELPARTSEPGNLVSAHDLAVPEAARKEFDAGEKLLQESHNASKSIGHFRKAVKIDDHFSQAYVLLGLAYLQEKNLKDAQAALERGVELDPQSAAGFITLGACLNQQKEYLGAEKALLRGLELEPESPEGQYEIARTYWATRRWQEAEPHALKAATLQPKLPGVHVVLGNIYLQKRDNTAALKEFNEYLHLEPQGPMSEGVRTMIAKLEKASK